MRESGPGTPSALVFLFSGIIAVMFTSMAEFLVTLGPVSGNGSGAGGHGTGLSRPVSQLQDCVWLLDDWRLGLAFGMQGFL